MKLQPTVEVYTGKWSLKALAVFINIKKLYVQFIFITIGLVLCKASQTRFNLWDRSLFVVLYFVLSVVCFIAFEGNLAMEVVFNDVDVLIATIWSSLPFSWRTAKAVKLLFAYKQYSHWGLREAINEPQKRKNLFGFAFVLEAKT